MKKFVSIDKKGKKEQKAFYSLQRGTWHEFNPVTRVVPDRKTKYSRKKATADLRRTLASLA